jgi:hypothetical protein
MKKISILSASKMCNLGNKNVHFCVIKVRMLTIRGGRYYFFSYSVFTCGSKGLSTLF